MAAKLVVLCVDVKVSYGAQHEVKGSVIRLGQMGLRLDQVELIFCVQPGCLSLTQLGHGAHIPPSFRSTG